jgi:rubrerythrin
MRRREFTYGQWLGAGEIAGTVAYLGCYSSGSSAPMFSSPSVMPGPEFPKWSCVFCGGVNRWMAGDKPPEKCRSCGAPERA